MKRLPFGNWSWRAACDGAPRLELVLAARPTHLDVHFRSGYRTDYFSLGIYFDDFAGIGDRHARVAVRQAPGLVQATLCQVAGGLPGPDDLAFFVDLDNLCYGFDADEGGSGSGALGVAHAHVGDVFAGVLPDGLSGLVDFDDSAGFGIAY